MKIEFLLNGEATSVELERPTQTLLEWLRERRGLTGTKEGCNEGDCGACTVMLTDKAGSRAVNACILFLPQVHGKAVRTVEGMAGPDGELHPVQRAMIDKHGSQCGFCTPGFVVSMATGHKNGDDAFDDMLAGNLCRCTGYAPIVRAAEAARSEPVPAWMLQDDAAIGRATLPEFDGYAFIPKSADDLADWYQQHPEAVLVAGGTDVGLWATKALREFAPVAYVGALEELQQIAVNDDAIEIGASVTIEALRSFISPHYPSFGELLRRFGSLQVRNSATLGGNIANGSPIGDAPPALIALGATLHLRKGDERRQIPLEDFFIEYGRQDRTPGEFVERIVIPRNRKHLACYKLSKRFDQDISSVCGCFSIEETGGKIASARIAFGGMAGTPKRALAAETAMTGAAWNEDTVRRAMLALVEDFQPLDDFRASARYRMTTAQNMVLRCWLEQSGQSIDILEVRA